MDSADDKLDRLLAMPFERFLEKCVDWKDATHPDISEMQVEQCPVHQRALLKGRCMTTVKGIRFCPVCGEAMCPDCGNHCCTQLSRVTGYFSAVSNWNSAKQQELKDRKRYDMEKTVGVGKR